MHAVKPNCVITWLTETVNRLLTDDWNPAGVRLVGFVHSHPASFFRPSGGNEIYAARILAHNKEQKFMVLPIVQSSADTREFAMQMFIACRDGSDACVERVTAFANTRRSLKD
jgi:hypothetical protein